ncbi:MAG TPA: shikimate dehydrogenase [Salinimicrobium sp.]|nr:shikimate dehydrogenase [Salinimicrobium sp.]
MKKEFQRENPRKFGLIGKNISYSFSKTYFEKKFEALGIFATYQNFDLTDISDFSEIKKQEISGLNVTIPYKEKIIKFLDELTPDAENIGAVNTIKLKNDKYIGFNTDFIGFLEAIKPQLLPHHKKALILGTGGASKAIAYALEKLGITYRFVSRKNEIGFLNYENITRAIVQEFSVIINCTPLGTFPEIDQLPPFPTDFLTSKNLVFDLIYNPEKTKLMKLAEANGATTSNGYKMLQIQAEEAWKIWNTL